MAKRKIYSPPIFQERFEQCLINTNMNCIEIGEKVGRERKTIYSYRDGVSTPDVVTLVKLCTLFKVSADWLIGLDK